MADKDHALQIISDFALRDTHGYNGMWNASIDRASVAVGAADRVNNPNLIDTSNVNLCGPACFIHALATDKPDEYAYAITALFEYAQAHFHVHGRTFEVKASKSLRNYMLPPGAGVDQSDWIMLASLRDSEEYFRSFASVNEEVGGITLPGELADWFKRAGYTDVRNSTNVYFNKDEANLQEVSDLYSKGYHVSLFISDNMLYSNKQDDGSRIPDHWVALASPITLDTKLTDDPNRRRYMIPNSFISLKVFTWGKVLNLPVGGPLKTESFLKNYYGYVACRY
jgi:hypothetical protein